MEAGELTAVKAAEDLELTRVHSTTLSVNGKTETKF